MCFVAAMCHVKFVLLGENASHLQLDYARESIRSIRREEIRHARSLVADHGGQGDKERTHACGGCTGTDMADVSLFARDFNALGGHREDDGEGERARAPTLLL